jgi:hypothetical protein
LAWQIVPAPKAQVPALPPVPLPQTLLSQSEPLWQRLPPPIKQVPVLAPVPLPQALLSQSPFL